MPPDGDRARRAHGLGAAAPIARGGRGAAPQPASGALLFAEPLGDIAKARLKVIDEHTDGFESARQDLNIRGPGEFLGARQSGVPMLPALPIWKKICPCSKPPAISRRN